MSKLSVYIIAYNEEVKIRPALESITWADEIIVADSGSQDNTAEIAREYGAQVIQIPFEGFGRLRNKAVDACTGDWVFSLDADERCTESVRKEIQEVIARPNDCAAFLVPRKNFFMGRWIRYSDWYPDFRQPQLFRKGVLRYTEDVVHEGYELTGKLGQLHHAIWQIPFADLSEIIRKMQRYSTLGAEKLEAKGVRSGMGKAFGHAVMAFVRMYILKFGFLDGWAGFVIALGNFEGTFYRYAKLAQIQNHWDQEPNRKELPFQ